MTGQLLVIAKAPMAGRSKTRLCPPCTPEQAAELAEAALRDTLAAVAGTRVDRRVIVLEGTPGPWVPSGFDVIPQRGSGLEERLASAFEDAHEDLPAPSLLIGMDTPQVHPALLEEALSSLGQPGVDAVLGRAEDGGYWAVGLTAPGSGLFRGVPMSTPYTYARQLERLRADGRVVRDLPRLRDVDLIDDAYAVAAQAPASRFAARLSEMFGEAA